jgi:hypothetical protein
MPSSSMKQWKQLERSTMPEERRSGWPCYKILFILLLVIFPILLLSSHFIYGAKSKHGTSYDPRDDSPLVGIDLSDEYIRMA